MIRDPEKALEAFLSGDFDMQRIRTPDVWQEKLDKPPVKKGYIVRAQFYNQTPRPCYSLRLNKSKPYLDDINIRLGLQHASNFGLVLEQYFRGRYERMQSSSDGYGEYTNPEVKARKFSAAKAREYFAKAGFTKSGADGILVNEQGERLSFTVTTGYKRLTDVLTILEREARKAGVEFQIEIIDSTAAWKKVQEKKHEICLTALNRSVELYPRYWDFWHSFNAYKEDGSVKPETNNFTVTAYPRVGQADRSIREVNRPCRDQGHCLRARTKNSRRCRLHSRVGSPVFSMRLLALGAMAGGIQFPSRS